MGIIVAIGGGELRKLETLAIDEYIVKLTGKKNPKALFIPTASFEAEGYIELFNDIYGKKLGCITDSLLLISGDLTDEQIRDKILSSDLIYVGGGHTVKMIEIWKSKKVDVYLKAAYEKGKILSGLSAGSICWFTYGHSDCDYLDDSECWSYIRCEGIGLINAIHCPHYNEEGRDDFDLMMKEQDLVGIALDNNCALVIKDNEYRVIKSDKNANAYRLINREGIVTKEIVDNEEYVNIEKLRGIDIM